MNYEIDRGFFKKNHDLSSQILENQKRLENVVKATSIGTWEWNIKTNEFIINEHFADILGYKLDELNPTYEDIWIKNVHEKDSLKCDRLIKEHFEGKIKYYVCDARVKHKDGSWRWVHDKGSVIKWDDDGSPLLMFGTLYDNTERKEMELERFKLTTAINQSSVTIVMTDTTGNIQYANPAFEKISGYSIQEAIGQNPRILKSGLMPEYTYKDMWDTIVSGDTWEGELINKRKDGSIYYELSRITPIIDSSGTIINFLGIKEDVTEKRISQKVIEKSEEKFRQLAENIDEIFWIKEDNNFIYINSAFERITGVKLDDIYKDSNLFFDIILDEDRDKVYNAINSDVKFNIEYRIVKPSGELRWIWNRASAVISSDDGTTRFLGVAADITVKKHLEEKLKQISIKDALTNIYNRRYIFERLAEFEKHYKQKCVIFSVAIIDIDFFKNVNDNYGHPGGDFVLQEFARLIGENIRNLDILGRYGGEEFVIIFESLDKGSSKIIVEKILEVIRNTTFNYKNNEIKITFSAGICECGEFNSSDFNLDNLVNKADERLYQAKQTGRNKVITS